MLLAFSAFYKANSLVIEFLLLHIPNEEGITI